MFEESHLVKYLFRAVLHPLLLDTRRLHVKQVVNWCNMLVPKYSEAISLPGT